MPKTIEVYTLEELKERNPKAFEKVHDKWKESQTDIPWSEETIDSLKAVIEACGGTLKRWEIGPYSHSYCNVDVENYTEDGELKDANWLLNEVLKPNGYINEHEKAEFPGICKFTGVCYDDDFLEETYKAMEEGNSLTDALQGLADKASKMMEDDCEQMQEEESMLANWGNNFYTIEGKPV